VAGFLGAAQWNSSIERGGDERWRRLWGETRLVTSARFERHFTVRRCLVLALSVRSEEDRTAGSFVDAQVRVCNAIMCVSEHRRVRESILWQ
jgi:hypothetical protein